MPDRTRPIRKEICLNEQELRVHFVQISYLVHNFGIGKFFLPRQG